MSSGIELRHRIVELLVLVLMSSVLTTALSNPCFSDYSSQKCLGAVSPTTHPRKAEGYHQCKCSTASHSGAPTVWTWAKFVVGWVRRTYFGRSVFGVPWHVEAGAGQWLHHVPTVAYSRKPSRSLRFVLRSFCYYQNNGGGYWTGINTWLRNNVEQFE